MSNEPSVGHIVVFPTKVSALKGLDSDASLQGLLKQQGEKSATKIRAAKELNVRSM